jgi:glycosyltransferase involved in cell wall biosynthesis
MNPHVSVIIPCFNQACFLSDAIDSLITQMFIDWECIIVNDGSTDNTADVAENLVLKDPRIRVINQANKGLSGARNSGLKAANGEMLQFLDADDMLERDKLTAQVEFLHANPDIDIVFGDARYFTTENPELRDYGPYAVDKTKAWIPALWNSQGTPLEKALSRNLFPVNCPLVRRSVFYSVGTWNEDLDAHEDWEFWIRCAAGNIKMEFLDRHDTLALIRMHATSMTFDSPRMRRTAFKMRITAGPLIKDPVLRMINFKKGLQALRLLKQSNILNPLVDLAYANRSFGIFFVALHFYIIENSVSRWAVNIYKKSAPWPIQKFIAKVLCINVN